MWVQKNSWFDYRSRLIKIGKPIEMDDIPKDLKRNEKVDFLTKEIERRTTQLQKELNEISHSLKK